VVGPLCRRLIALCDEALSVTESPDAKSALETVRSSLEEPLRVALVGRVSSGKSTIVNALVGQRVAATAIGETTRVVTWFRFGARERAVLTRRDGTTAPVPLRADGSLPPDLGEEPGTIERIEVWLSSGALREMTIIDTPGLASLTGAGNVTSELLAIDGDSRAAISLADAMVLVMAGDAHEDDVAILQAFRDLLGGLRTTSVNAIGALNKIDRIAGGQVDALEIGRERAASLTKVLRGLLAGVVPIVGLVAETTETGALSDADVRTVRELARMDDGERALLVMSAERFTSRPAPVSEAARRELLTRLDITGVRTIVEATAGGTDVIEALEGLRELAGLERLRHELARLFTSRVDALKAEWGIATLDRLSGGAFPASLAGGLEEILVDPTMHPLRELRALQQASADDGLLPGPLIEDLVTLVEGRSLRERLGLPPAASNGECQAAAAAGSGRWAEFSNSGQASPAARRIAETARRSFDLMWQQAEG
jgi:energy-coupling factor transporter ATP-binding protein EcfA2